MTRRSTEDASGNQATVYDITVMDACHIHLSKVINKHKFENFRGNCILKDFQVYDFLKNRLFFRAL